MYRDVVQQIRKLHWGRLSPPELQSLMVLSWYAATEFAESLRIAVNRYRRSEGLRKMARGELKTRNLVFDGYGRKGDHSDFLGFFIEKNGSFQKCGSAVGIELLIFLCP